MTARDDAPCYEGWSGIVNLDWENDAALFQQELGEIWGESRPYTPGIVPPGLNNKPCGTAEQFEHGEPYDPARPPQRYGAFGWPLCCDPPFRLFGFAAASGRVVVEFVRHDPMSGGGEGGGSFAEALVSIDPMDGGGAGGGTFSEQIVGSDPMDGGGEGGGSFGDELHLADAMDGGGEGGGSFAEALVSIDPMDGGGAGGGSFSEQIVGSDPMDGGGEGGGSFGDELHLADAMDGGGEGGGSFAEIIYTADVMSGGGVGGGSFGDALTTTDDMDGGGEGGGSFGDSYTPPGPTPGNSCATAGAITVGQTYSGTAPASPNNDWFVFTQTNGTHYTVTITGSAALREACHAGTGSCPTPTAVFIPFSGNGSGAWTAASTGSCWIWVGGAMGGAYTLALTSP